MFYVGAVVGALVRPKLFVLGDGAAASWLLALTKSPRSSHPRGVMESLVEMSFWLPDLDSNQEPAG